MITRARSALTGLAALTLLVLLVAGLPAVLYRFGGSPVPNRLPSAHTIGAALARQDSGSILLAVIKECSWLAWLLFAGCVLAEAQAAIRGHRSPRLRLGGLQGAAAQLVALAALAFSAPSGITLAASVTAASGQSAASHGGDGDVPAAPQYLASPAGSAGQQPAEPGSASAPASRSDAADVLDFGSAPASATRLITVRSGDCLWSIAQRYLGAGDRYPEIVSLNYGHDMGDGQVFTNPSLIEPGWRLFLPGDDPGSAVSPAQSAGSQHLGHATKDSHYRRRHPSARTGASSAAASREAGQGGAAPGTGAQGSAALAVGSQGSAGAESGAAAADPGAGEHAASGEAAGQPVGGPAGAAQAADRLAEAAIFVSGALAGAALTSLARLRRRQRQDRRRGRRIALPADRGVLAAEQRLRAAAPDEPLETLRDALALLESGIVGAGQQLPDIVGLHVTPDVLEVLLAAPAADAPPAPFAISPGRQGMCWQLDLPAVTAAAGSGTADAAGLAAAPVSTPAMASVACHLLPGLITAGTTGDGYLLVDLESLRVTGCDGPPDLVDRVLTTIAAELATGQWSGWYELILVGFDELEVLGRAEHCATLDGALSMLEARGAAAGRRIADRAAADVRELRLAEPDDEDWGLAVLVCRTEPEPGQLARLLELAEDGCGGIAALVAGDQETPGGRMAPTVLQLAPDSLVPGGIIANVVPLQITVRPRALTGADYDAIATLFAVAADLDDVSPQAEPYAVYGAPPWIPQAATMEPPAAAGLNWAGDPDPAAETDLAAGEDEPADTASGQSGAVTAGHVRIRILGPFVITGTAGQLQPKQAELLLALALAAPAGLSNSALCSMLGADPDHPKPPDALRQIITRTRRRVGPASDGQEYIIHAGNGHYVLHPDAVLDWTRFRELAEAGRPDHLRAAMSLIGGQPFTGSYFWWIDVPLIETVRAEVVDVAETLAEFELAMGSPRAAARAARAGLLAESSAEQLWRAVMRAEDAAGNLAGVTEAWRRCLDAIEDIAPGGEPHPDTSALYRQLTTSGRLHAPAS